MTSKADCDNLILIEITVAGIILSTLCIFSECRDRGFSFAGISNLGFDNVHSKTRRLNECFIL